EHFAGQDLAQTTLERQPAIAAARPRRAARALGAEIEQVAILGVAALGEEKPAPVAQIGIIGAELMDVIAQSQGLGKRAGQGREAPEMIEPFAFGQLAQPQPLGPGLVTVAQDQARKFRRAHGIEKIRAQGRMLARAEKASYRHESLRAKAGRGLS